MVTEWQGRLQFRVDRIRLIGPQDGVNPEDFVQTAPMKPEDMLGKILQYVIKIGNRDIKEIVSCALNEKKEKLMHYPAAMKNHHAIRSGLLYHILTMLSLAERVCQVYPHLDRDLLYGGVILHDLEKINEMDSNELGVVSGYTMEGMLLGHIVQGIKTIERIGRQVDADPEIVILLQHMLLSHHYEPEFGSPKRPMIPEGEILHYLDIIDARMYDMQKELEAVEEGQFSDRVWVLHNRQLYKYRKAEDEGKDVRAEG
jgi:3'-5' exoribonuclease